MAGLPSRSAFELITGRALAKQTGKGQCKWAMVIDLKVCLSRTDCRDCIDACHRIHNVPTLANPKDEVKWIWASPYKQVFPEHTHRFLPRELQERAVLVLCNHCDNPPCVKVCPTRATFKRDDGLVMMDYHRCIGCRYCMAACPYGARSFNWRNPRPFIKEMNREFPTRTSGVVEKCSFCEERLVNGLMPACVEACPSGALAFGDLTNSDSPARRMIGFKTVLRRRPHLGTEPKVFYVL